MPGVYKPDRISKRDLTQIRVKAMVAFALPGDMWPHTQMSRPSCRWDSCSGLSSDWLAAKAEPAGVRDEAPAPNPTETAGKGTANTGPLNPRCCPACSPPDTVTGKSNKALQSGALIAH